jgi:hypothetical protein
VSSLEADAEAALVYTAPEDLPVVVLAVGYGDAIAAPDTVETVEVTWAYRDRPGTFLSVQSKTGNWQAAMDAYLRLQVYRIEAVYALLGGWPAPTPLPTELPAPEPGAVPFE